MHKLYRIFTKTAFSVYRMGFLLRGRESGTYLEPKTVQEDNSFTLMVNIHFYG